MGRKIVVDADDLTCLVGYVYTLLDFIDIDDFGEEENRDLVVNGFDECVKPMMREDFESPFTFVRNDEVQVFREHLEEGFGVDTSDVPFEDVKKFYEKVLEKYDSEANEIYCDIITKMIHEKELNESKIDGIIDTAKIRTENIDNKQSPELGFVK